MSNPIIIYEKDKATICITYNKKGIQQKEIIVSLENFPIYSIPFESNFSKFLHQKGTRNSLNSLLQNPEYMDVIEELFKEFLKC